MEKSNLEFMKPKDLRLPNTTLKNSSIAARTHLPDFKTY